MHPILVLIQLFIRNIECLFLEHYKKNKGLKKSKLKLVIFQKNMIGQRELNI